jgi:hypothetical protein
VRAFPVMIPRMLKKHTAHPIYEPFYPCQASDSHIFSIIQGLSRPQPVGLEPYFGLSGRPAIFSKHSKNSGKLLPQHSGFSIWMPGMASPVSAKLIAIL